MNVLGTKWLFVTLILLFNILIQENIAQYIPPTPTVEPLYPKGIRMSIPHEDGISLVAYHVKFNEDFNGLEAGAIARDIVKIRNGRWTYEDRTTRLKRGDRIYYWIHVVYDGLGYNLLDQQHVVTDFYQYDGTPVREADGNEIVCATPSNTKIFGNDTNFQLKRQNVCPGQLIFEENFDTLNTTRWTVIERFSDGPSYEFVVYMDNEDNVKVKDGILHITLTSLNDKYGQDFVRTGNLILEKCTGIAYTPECSRTPLGPFILPPIISGRLNTRSSFAFLYGRIQVRAKLPYGDWIYPLITLESIDRHKTNITEYCDIIIALATGNPSLKSQNGQDLSGHILLGGAHVTDINQQSIKDNQLRLPNIISNTLWSSNYHVYDLEWRSGRISVKVDGEQYGEQQVPALYDTPVYVNLGLAVGGVTTFPDSCISGNYVKPWRNIGSKALYTFYLDEKNWIQSWRNADTGLHIDYVKIWAI
ncbi:PREDICTED: beta-1,3-glucan-binding protein 1-like [Eufriesea mexicana]|uniref:beta-1,3-glucan-binding protein 1-like n=1 Tax=Eufriesea mexicana TaxID=516756 RepID=UPI00083BF073|nr:PREDICTED: beta-1,3-glucan-binding protein 1-like [Eufriesea mexicana]